MIGSIKHKGLRQFVEEGSPKGLMAEHVEKIGRILTAMEAAAGIEALDMATFRLHALKGDLKGYWAITVRANWRLTFRFKNGQALDVDLVDYH